MVGLRWASKVRRPVAGVKLDAARARRQNAAWGCRERPDSLIKRLDEDRYARKFTPRKPGSAWSESNRKRWAELEAEGSLAPADATHAVPPGRRPTYDLHLQQWTAKLASAGSDRFCYLVTDRAGTIVGFASGGPYRHADLPVFDAQLAKIYLLRDDQRLGLGRRLVAAVMHRLVDGGGSGPWCSSLSRKPIVR